MHKHARALAETRSSGWKGRRRTAGLPPRRTRRSRAGKDSSRNAARGPEQSSHLRGGSVRAHLCQAAGPRGSRIRPRVPGSSEGPSHLRGLCTEGKGGWSRGAESQPQIYPLIPAGPRTRKEEDTHRSGRNRFPQGRPLSGGSRPTPRRWPRPDAFSSCSPVRRQVAPSVKGPTFTLPDNGQQL